MPLLCLLGCTIEVGIRGPELGNLEPGLDEVYGQDPPDLVWCQRQAGNDTLVEAELLDHGPGWAAYAYDWPDTLYEFDCDPVDLEDVGASVCTTTLHGIAGPHSVLCLEEAPWE
ncbi:MAG: hypothetical protein AAF211_27460 [Myxococcota bacterium]